MRNLLYICLIGLVALACDDGDIFEVTLDFDQELDLCIDVNEGNYLLYDTKLEPSESLSFQFPINGNVDVFAPTVYNSEDPYGYTKTITINETSNTFNYRVYSGDPDDLICQINPDPGTLIIENYSSAAGAEAKILTTFEDDDLDGIPSEDEGRGLQDPDGTYPNAQDTDGDGLPDYLDEDDDNDNVLTKNEFIDPNGDGDFSDALNTDLAIEIANNVTPIPNYLDNDDDGDMILSINEDANGNSSLTDDFDESDGVNAIPRYLDDMATESFTAGDLLETEFTRTTTVNVTIENSNLGIASIDMIAFGTYTFPTVFSPFEDDDDD